MFGSKDLKRSHLSQDCWNPFLLELLLPRFVLSKVKPDLKQPYVQIVHICYYVKKYQTKYKYLLIDQINDDVDHLVGLCLLCIVLASKSKLLRKEPDVPR